MTEEKMVGWHHGLNGHEFEPALGDGEVQGSLRCCSPRDHKESDMTEQLNNNSSFLSFLEQPLCLSFQLLRVQEHRASC